MWRSIDLNVSSTYARWFDWDKSGGNKNGKLRLQSSDKELTQLEEVGQQLAVAFSGDGSLLAVGGEVNMINHLPLVMLHTQDNMMISLMFISES